LEPPVIDMMSLADLGQPRRIAFEIHKQLRAQYGSVPLRMPLAEVASAVGIAGIKEFDTDAFDGTLLIRDGVGAIGIRAGMSPGRRNFTIGHELGHFLIPTHRMRNRKFECTPKHMRYQRARPAEWDQRPAAERIEVEANEFAAAFLVPAAEYRAERAKLARRSDVSHIRPLAEAFGVSQEMMASVYVGQSPKPTAVVTSQNGIVRRIIAKPDFPYLGLRNGMEIPRGSLTRDFRAVNDVGAVSAVEDIEIHTWAERKGAIASLCEQAIIQRNGWAMTMLTVEEEETDDEADDTNWNRRNYRPSRPSWR
jgi:Zn-dependent peptidase ImmA (M78 family)